MVFESVCKCRNANDRVRSHPNVAKGLPIGPNRSEKSTCLQNFEKLGKVYESTTNTELKNYLLIRTSKVTSKIIWNLEPQVIYPIGHFSICVPIEGSLALDSSVFRLHAFARH